MKDTFNLHRFIKAQQGIYPGVVQELRAGQKRTHWMWYIFPQIIGLGESSTSIEYAISSRDEAIAYLEHSILGARLRECTQLVLNLEGRTAAQIFAYPDTLKFRSCMTLFEASAKDSKIFRDVLAKYFNGKADLLTLEILKRQ